MRIVHGPGVMDTILEGISALVEAGDLGYTGSLWAHTGVSRTMAYVYMRNHPDCTSPEDAVARIKAERARRKAAMDRLAVVKSGMPSKLDRMAELTPDTMIGKFIIVPRSYGAIGKVVGEKTVGGNKLYHLEVATKGGRTYEDDVDSYGIQECTDPQMINTWYQAYRLPNPRSTDNISVSSNGVKFVPGDAVHVTGGTYKDFDGTVDGRGAIPGTVAVKMTVFGVERIADIAIGDLISDRATSAGTAPAVPAGTTVRKAVWPGKMK